MKQTEKIVFVFTVLNFLVWAVSSIFGQTFDIARISYDIEYKLKSSTPDTVISIDSTGFIELILTWDAVTGFGDADEEIDYDESGLWTTIENDYKQTTIEKTVHVVGGIYSFRVWSKYAYRSGNVVRSVAPSPEYLVRFKLKENPPERVTLKIRFKAKQ